MSVTPAFHQEADSASTTQFSFSKKALLELTEPGRYIDTHKNASGLSLEIRTQDGPKTFRIRKRLHGKSIQVTLGRFPDLTLDQARKKAADATAKIAQGINPNDEKKAKRQKVITLDELYTQYLTFKKLRPSTIRGYNTSFRNVLHPLANKPVTEISYEDVLKAHQAYSEKSFAEADRAMRLLRAVFFYAMDELKDIHGKPLIAENPVRKLFKNKQVHKLDRKTRKLEDDQIRPFIEFMETLQSDPRKFFSTGADCALVLLFHGTRLGETTRIKWENVDLRYKRFWLDETKNGRRLWLPMNTYTFEIFKRRSEVVQDSSFVFPSVTDAAKSLSDIKKPLKAFLQETGIEITPHDLRRTFLGQGNRLNFSQYTLKQLSNHAIDSADVTAGYVIQSADELREPSQKIANRFLELAGKKQLNTDSLLQDMLKGLDDEQKRKLIFQLTNQALQNAN